MDKICSTCGSTWHVYRMKVTLGDGVTTQITQPLCPSHRLDVRRQLESMRVERIEVLMEDD